MINTKKYGELLINILPQVIDSNEEYDRVEGIFEKLINKNRSPEEDKLFDLLADLLENYEKKTLPPRKAFSPIETLGILMRENNIKQTDLADIFGGQSVVSDILKGKRQINLKQAKLLAEKFSMKIEAFI